ncbi:RNA polymerase sigma-70 factor (ECF subfamily) [Sphingobium xenophagum]|uniref:RNA polymerase sigma-70 factor (ECF subfamily) n=1 Tax=Sphingobium xenophagum TaxID=121428 RepID=A0ABU1X291_SPHXE|nr:iron dicitrate transport regulator FecR [Sphingobium xenophagum]MDR7155697.1 RNA polymerase sigma-70 factor (ECF subfamily) [Sphingobium xenophagum]
MTDPLARRVFLRRGRRSLRRMTYLQRAIFFAIRMEDLTYAQLAERHDITARQAEAEFAAALRIFLRTVHEPEPWWRRLSHRL